MYAKNLLRIWGKKNQSLVQYVRCRTPSGMFDLDFARSPHPQGAYWHYSDTRVTLRRPGAIAH